MRLPPPYTQTLFVDLIRFTPGQPDNIAANGAPMSAPPTRTMPGSSNPPPMTVANGSSAHPRSMHPSHSSHPHHNNHHHHAISAPPPSAPSYENGRPSSSSHVPPPPPWAATSRWSSAAAAAAPPGPSRPIPPPPPAEQLRSPIAGMQTPPLAQRKRKYTDDMLPHGPPPDDRLAPAPIIRTPKRLHSTVSTPQPSASAPRSSQGMSPSLALMLSPTPGADIRSPTRQAPPPNYNRSIPPSPGGRSGPTEDPQYAARQQQKMKLVYPGQHPGPRSEDERWASQIAHDTRSPQIPPPPRH